MRHPRMVVFVTMMPFILTRKNSRTVLLNFYTCTLSAAQLNWLSPQVLESKRLENTIKKHNFQKELKVIGL